MAISTSLPTWNGILQNAWKLGQELTILSTSVDIKLTISPTENAEFKVVLPTVNVFR